MQFHLNGFEPGDPEIADPAERYPASGAQGPLPDEVDVLIVGSGPAGLTLFLRSLGDDVSRLDRNEPDLNIYAPGDERDTTSPAAMLHTAHALLVSDRVLSTSSRQLLGVWLSRASTGLKRLRSAFPSTFRTGDKTGTGDNGATNDIAIGWRASGKPVLLLLDTDAGHGIGSTRSQVQEELANKWSFLLWQMGDKDFQPVRF